MSPATPRTYPDIVETDYGLLLRSPAKVNLSLRILGKRPDGFHELDTYFQELDWADTIEIWESEAFGLEVVGADLPKDESNLIVRAARALAAAAEVNCRGLIRLNKVLPLQGGVGGGSSNAAVTLLGLNRLWGLNWPLERLVDIAAGVGADCPFFLYGGLAHGTGRGDEIVPLAGAMNGALLLVVPPFGVETPWAFSQVRLPLTEAEKNVIFSPLLLTEEGRVYPPIFACNDLENIIFHRHPELQIVRERLQALGASVSLLSGSGSSIFGLFSSEADAHRAANMWRASQDAWRVVVCRPVARVRGNQA